MATSTTQFKRAAAKYGHLVDGIGHRYSKNLTGAELLLKVAKGESSFDMGAVSSAGARGATQFMPGSRQEAIKKYGVDPWKNPDQAMHGAALHLLGKINGSKGLEGYNPGSSSYPAYILGQKVGKVKDAPGGKDAPATGKPGKFDAGTPPTLTPGKTEQDVSGALLDALMAGKKGRQGKSLLGATMSLLDSGDYDRHTPAKITPGRAASYTPGDTGGAAPSKGKGPKALVASGGWGGAKGPATQLAKIGESLGLKPTSTKRHNTNPYSGSHSDHDVGNKDAYAYDLSNGSAPTPEMDEAAYKIMHRLGFKDYKKGTPIDTASGVKTINGVRYQIIYRGSGARFGGNHMNHVHVGVKHVG